MAYPIDLGSPWRQHIVLRSATDRTSDHFNIRSAISFDGFRARYVTHYLVCRDQIPKPSLTAGDKVDVQRQILQLV